MATSPRIGLLLLSATEPTNVDRALWAEERGFDSVWLADGGGRMHALTAAGGIAARTRRVTVGLGVVPVFTHTPAVLASAVLALSTFAPGRVIVGLGSSSKPMMEGWSGIPFRKPLTRVRETAVLLRKILRGEKTAFEGETLSSNGFRLFSTPPQAVPIFLAALRPKMLELAGEVGDGVILHLCPPRVIPNMLEHTAEGARRAGRSAADFQVVVRTNVYVTADKEKARAEFRKLAANYYSTAVYNKFLAWCGFEAEAARISAGFRQRDRSMTLGALNDEVCDQLAVIGSADECREAVRAMMAMGVTTPIIYAASENPGEREATMEAFSPDNFH